jgi:hypothetical protein
VGLLAGDGPDRGLVVDPLRRKHVLVAVNTGSAQTITFDLSRFGTVPGATVPRWSTATSGSGDRYTQRVDMRPDGKLLRVPFAARAVQTLQIDGVAQ